MVCYSNRVVRTYENMRKKLLFLQALFVLWIIVVLVIFSKLPPRLSTAFSASSKYPSQATDIQRQLDSLEHRVGEQSEFYKKVLQKLHQVADAKKKEDQTTLAVLLIACNREEAVRRSLDMLLKYRPDQARFPITVSQDCGHQPTKQAILSYGNQVSLIEQPDLSIIEVPPKEKKFKGYFYIARHYKWALDYMFKDKGYEAVIIVEDDLDVSPDIYEYFAATYPILKSDPTLWCVSAWNDNGKGNLVDVANGASTLYRTDFFPGLGWMLTQSTWLELSPKWPKSYWDDWMRAPEQRRDRACIRPEVSRTRTFGKKGVSNGLFFEKHLKYIHLNEQKVDFSAIDLSYLKKPNFDKDFDRRVQTAEVVTLEAIKSDSLPTDREYRVIYHTKDIFKKITKALGLMDDFKAGVPRTGYKGVVSFMLKNRRIFLAPNNNWKGYDPAWS